MGVGRQEMDEPFLKHPLGHFPARGTKCAHQTACGYLHETAVVDERRDDIRLFQKPLISFRVREDAGESHCPQTIEDPFDREVQLVWQFQQDVFSAIRQSDHFAQAEP